MTKIISFLMIFFLSFSQSALAFDDITIDDGSGTGIITRDSEYGGVVIPINIDKGYCIHSYEKIFEGNLYTCNRVKSVWYQYETVKPDDSTWFKFQCWQAVFSANQNTNDNFQDTSGLITSQEYYYSSTSPNPDYILHPCRLKVVTKPGSCEINSSEIISLAFSQKFPLDLFTGLQGFSSANTCPQLTVNNRTFQLCYLNKLVKSIKYVLLLVFVLTSLLAL